MFNNPSPAPSPATVAADQSRQNASLNWLRSAAIDTNINNAGEVLSNNLKRFDDMAGQAQGTTALSLARSGAMTSRARSSILSRSALGIAHGVADPLEAARKAVAGYREDLATGGEFGARIAALNAEIETLRKTREIFGTRDVYADDYDAVRDYFDSRIGSEEARIQTEINNRRAAIQGSIDATQGKIDAAKDKVNEAVSSDAKRIQAAAGKETRGLQAEARALSQQLQGDISADEAASVRDRLDDIRDEISGISGKANDEIPAVQELAVDEATASLREKLSGLQSELDSVQWEDSDELIRLQAQKNEELSSRTSQEQYVVGTEEYWSDPERYGAILVEIEGIEDEKADWEVGINEKIEYLDELIPKIEEFGNEVLADAGMGGADVQQLGYTAGSTLVTVSRGLDALRQQRDQIFSQGVGGVAQFFQEQMAAEQQAEFDLQTAREYMQLADMQKQQQDIQNIFSGIGLVGGIALSPILGPAAMSLGMPVGSFLGNVFASQVR